MVIYNCTWITECNNENEKLEKFIKLKEKNAVIRHSYRI